MPNAQLICLRRLVQELRDAYRVRIGLLVLTSMFLAIANQGLAASSSALDGPASPLARTLSPQALPTQTRVCTGAETVLVLQDVTPWASAPGGSSDGAIVDELTAQNKSWCLINSGQIQAIDLSQFSEIIIASAQTQTFYNNLFPGGNIDSKITAWVENGGTLLAHLADCASGPGNGGTWASVSCGGADVNTSYTFVGGLKHVTAFSQTNDIASASHLIITDDLPCPGQNCAPIVDAGTRNDLDSWGYSSHGILVRPDGTLPVGAAVVITDPTMFAPAAIMIDIRLVQVV